MIRLSERALFAGEDEGAVGWFPEVSPPPAETFENVADTIDVASASARFRGRASGAA
jgi:hypothetical protein